MLHLQATTAIHRLRAYQNQSQLPEGLGNWSQRQFVIIDHDPQPDDESVAIDRVARVVHSLLTPGAGKSDAETLLFAAARALVEAPFRVLRVPKTCATWAKALQSAAERSACAGPVLARPGGGMIFGLWA